MYLHDKDSNGIYGYDTDVAGFLRVETFTMA